jgi:5,10-methylenetetrahydromethanopterin reductase
MMNGGILVNQSPGVPVARMVELAQAAECFGFVRCWVADQGLDTRDVFVTLTAMAAKTSTLQLGPGITNPLTRHPAIAAASIASLDELAGGRAFHGIGAGGLDTLRPMGLKHHKPVTAVREMIETTRALYRREGVSFRGETIQLNNARLDYARPDIEIWVASRSAHMLALAGELADGVMLGFIHKESFQNYLDLIRAGAQITGNRPKLAYYALMITDERTLEAIRPQVLAMLMDSPPLVKERLGLTNTELEHIRRETASAGWAKAGALIRDEFIRPFAMMGLVTDCAVELTEFMTRFGIDEFLIPLLEPTSARELLAQVASALAFALDATPGEIGASAHDHH